MIYTPFIWFPLTSAIISGIVAYYMRGFQDVPSVKPFIRVMWLGASWAFLYALDASTSSIPLKTFIVNVTYIPALLTSIAWFVTALDYTGHAGWLTRQRLIALLILPALFVIAAFTSHHHMLWRYDYQLIWPGPVPTQIASKGIVYWIYFAYMLAMVAATVIVLLSSFQNRNLYPHNTILLIIGLLIPSITGTLFVFGFLPVRGFDWTSTSFIFQTALYIWAILRGHLFNIIPIARAIVMEDMDDMVIVTNLRGYIVDLNRAAQSMLGLSPTTIGTAPNTLSQPWAALFEDYNREFYKGEVLINIQGAQRDFDLSISPIKDKQGQILGRLFLLHDTTEKNQVKRNLQQQNAYFSILHQITLDLLNQQEPENLLNNIAEHAASLVSAQHGFIFLAEGDVITLRAATGEFSQNIGKSEPKPGSGVLGKVWREKIPFFTENYGQWEFRDPNYEGENLRAVAGVPINAGDDIIGVLEVANTNDTRIFNNDELEILNRFATLAALVLNNAQLYRAAQHELTERKNTEEELRLANQKLHSQLLEIQALESILREQVIRDPLTGLYNRRHLNEMLERELAYASREGSPISFVMIDIDHFKNINDNFGHGPGDKILQSLVNQILGQTRVGDIICRYGGEEFLAVLPNVTSETAFQIAERWRTAFSESKTLVENEEVSTTISCGISTFPMHGDRGDTLINRADQAMYHAKKTGRNKVVTWREEFAQTGRLRSL
ncbi:MAG: diguanylate cyclase [Anaerolineales bacterium]|nr:diguanylate cyclase [Anaerolineales bacterium]